MSPEEMLRNVGEHGEDAASDYNDSLDGWFGWSISEESGVPQLKVTWTPADEDADAMEPVTRSWYLVPELP